VVIQNLTLRLGGRKTGLVMVCVCVLCTYRYFISVSRTSEPPSDLYIRLKMGDISDCRMDWRISITVARCVSCSFRQSVVDSNSECEREKMRLWN